MPGTTDEILALVTLEDTPPAFLWADGTAPTAAELADVAALRGYRRTLLWRRRSGPQRVAMRLLRSLLSADQRASLRRSKSFLVIASSGRAYRLWPALGSTELVTRHGTRWYVLLRYCLHDDRSDPGLAMPPADLSVAHLLLLLADEDGFRAEANARHARDQLWNPDYLRRVRRPLERMPI